MDGKKPSIIMTDQDKAIKSAIDDVLFSIWHRFCLWHIMNNCSDKMGGFMAAREGMEDEMRNIIMDSLTIEEFESKWNAMIEKYDAASSKHLPLMWKCRSQWVPVYFRKVFCPFIRTTGRSEGMNSIFKDYVKRKDTLETFLVQYELFQETIIEAENDDRFVSIGLEPIYWGHNLVEKHAGKIYTRGIFFKFQDEMHNSTAFGVEVIEENKIYNLKKNFNYKGQEFHQQSFRVEVDRTNELFDCICGKFERDGILCCHVLRLFTQFDINQIPDHYINKRWTKEYRETELLKHKKRMIDEGAGSESSQVSMRYAIVMNKVSDLCAEVCKDANSSKEFLEEIQKLQEKYTLKHKTQPAQGAPPHQEPLKDPPIRSNKSVDKGDRLKRQSEKKTDKKKAKKKNADDKSDLP
ncbi:protein FAR1-RELATED SEQUENCE 5-like [Lolium perenne]|uniref:protein FAR1-RELATED SEQUENCE 5-like n=1 Tax=Lolium perenne TaxID=4522 RepID=UPI003A99ADBE